MRPRPTTPDELAAEARRMALTHHALDTQGRIAVWERLRVENPPLYSLVRTHFQQCLLGDLTIANEAKRCCRNVSYRKLAKWRPDNDIPHITALSASDESWLSRLRARERLLRTNCETRWVTHQNLEVSSLEPESFHPGQAQRRTMSELLDEATSGEPAEFLYRIIRHFRITEVLEIGTGVGLSSAYLAAAIQAEAEVIKTMAFYVGIEFCPAMMTATLNSLAAINGRYLRHAVIPGDVREVFPATLRIMRARRFTSQPGLQFVYLDGFQYPEYTLRLFRQCAAEMPKGGVICVDDLDSARLFPIKQPLVDDPRVQAFFQVPGKPAGLYCFIINREAPTTAA